MDPQRWSEESIAKNRLENLAKAREAKKKKLENSGQPFTITPITETPVLNKSNEDEPIQRDKETTTKQRILAGTWDFVASVSTATIVIITPIVLGMLRDTFLLYYYGTDDVYCEPTRDKVQKSNNPPQSVRGFDIFRQV